MSEMSSPRSDGIPNPVPLNSLPPQLAEKMKPENGGPGWPEQVIRVQHFDTLDEFRRFVHIKGPAGKNNFDHIFDPSTDPFGAQTHLEDALKRERPIDGWLTSILRGSPAMQRWLLMDDQNRALLDEMGQMYKEAKEEGENQEERNEYVNALWYDDDWLKQAYSVYQGLEELVGTDDPGALLPDGQADARYFFK